jgi:hypothetical protein
MQSLSNAELESQSIQELPDRDLMGAVFWVTGSIDIALFENLLNHTFHHWSISVLDNNHVQVTVEDELTETQVGAFCNESATAFSAQCTGWLT